MPSDETVARVYWMQSPHKHFFALPYMDYPGLGNRSLSYTGWFEGDALVGYFMRSYGSAQWSYEREEIVKEIAVLLGRSRIRFTIGMEATAWPVLECLGIEHIKRYEPSTVALLPPDALNRDALEEPPGRARPATLADLDQLAEVYVASPELSSHLDYHSRHDALRAAILDPRRRVYLAETPECQVASVAQTAAEGSTMAVVSSVATHPSLRGRGYATLVTAHLCAALVHENIVPYLFYCRDNTTAARVYEKIGFVPKDNALFTELKMDLL